MAKAKVLELTETERLELENGFRNGKKHCFRMRCRAILLKAEGFYADESHVCTEGYVPYGWLRQGEDVYIPSQRIARMNIFGMIDRDNHYEGFTTFERMATDKVMEFLDMFSFFLSSCLLIPLT